MMRPSMMHTSLFYLFLPVLCMSDFIGSAKVKIQRLEKCADDGPEVFVNFSIQSFNRTHQGINLYIVCPFAVGEGTKMNTTVSKWGDGGWKPHILDLYEADTCEFFMKYAKGTFREFLRNHGQPEQCPMAKGTYQVGNFIHDGTVDVPIMFGDFKAEVILSREEVALTCVRVFFHSEPQNKYGMGMG